MIITRKSPLTNIVHSMDLPVTEEQLTRWYAGTPIQNAMPNLNADQREFIMTGITSHEWDTAFAEDKRE